MLYLGMVPTLINCQLQQGSKKTKIDNYFKRVTTTTQNISNQNMYIHLALTFNYPSASANVPHPSEI